MDVVIDATNAINDVRAIQRYVWNLLSQISEDDSNITYCFLLLLGWNRFTKLRLPKLNRDKVDVVYSRIPGKFLKLTWDLFSFPDANFFIKRNFRLFHFPGGYTYLPVKKAKIITTLHGFAPLIVPNCFEEKVISNFKIQIEKTISQSDHFITVSNTNKEELNKIWGISSDRISVIPLGIGSEFRIFDLNKNKEEEIRNKYSLGNKKFFLYVGSCEPCKNIKAIIDAYSLLDRRIKEKFNLVLVGPKTKYVNFYIDLARKYNILDKLVFIDYIQPGSEELAIIYNLAELFIFPSFYEGWASPPLEAMKCGIPVIVSNIPALIESTGGVAEYCAPENPEEISFAIQKLIEDLDLRRKKIEDGIKFSSTFTWKLCAERTIQLYNKMIKESFNL